MSVKLKLMTSNIWGNCPPNLPIAERDDKLAAVFRHYVADIIGLQECSTRSRAERLNIINLSLRFYDELPITLPATKKNNYTPILYNRDTLNVIDSGWHCFSGLNDVSSKSITWGIFEVKESGCKFLCFNTHFYWKKTDPGRAARICNTGELLELYWKIKDKHGELPTFIIGDLNSRSDEPPIKVLAHYGFTEARYTAEESSPYKSYHDYPVYDPVEECYSNGVMPSEAREESIDHILCTRDVVVKKFVTVTDREALDSSDHCPLYADVEIG